MDTVDHNHEAGAMTTPKDQVDVKREKLYMNGVIAAPEATVSQKQSDVNHIGEYNGNVAAEDACDKEFYHTIKKLLKDNNIIGLRKIAYEEGGYRCDNIRALVWPRLGHVDSVEGEKALSEESLKKHPSYTQVVLDVNRSIKRFPPSVKEEQRIALQDKLVILIMRILAKNPHLHYYQGYHDVCVTVLLVLGEKHACLLMDRLSRTKLACHMGRTLDETSRQLDLIYPIFHCEHAKLCAFMEAAEVGTIFCLSWVITWFGHVLAEYDEVVRLYDLFIADDDSLLPLYFSAAVVLRKADNILQLECSMPTVHQYLTRLVDEPALPIENLVKKALQLRAAYPRDLLEDIKIKRDKEKVQREIRKLRIQRLRVSAITLYRNITGPWRGTIIAAAFAFVAFELYRRNAMGRFSKYLEF